MSTLDLVVAKTVYVATLAGVVGGGFQAFRMAEDWKRRGLRPDAVAYLRELDSVDTSRRALPSRPSLLPWLRESYLAALSPRKAIAVTAATEALFVARPIASFVAVTGLVGWALHGADDAMLYNFTGDPVATGAGVAACGASWAHRATPTARAGTALAAVALYAAGTAFLKTGDAGHRTSSWPAA